MKTQAQKTEEAMGFHRREAIEFATWYSGMDREKVFKAYQRWRKEIKKDQP